MNNLAELQPMSWLKYFINDYFQIIESKLHGIVKGCRNNFLAEETTVPFSCFKESPARVKQIYYQA